MFVKVFCLSGADRNGQTDVQVFLKVFCLSGADINGQARDGASPLFEACKNGHVSAVDVLLSLKADANQSLKSGLLPLHVAVQNNHIRSETSCLSLFYLYQLFSVSWLLLI